MSRVRRKNWKTARADTLELWRRIRAMIDEGDELALLIEINAICALCEAAGEREPRSQTRCERCLAFQQFGGCQQVNLEMSERVVQKDWQALRGLVEGFIRNLETLEIPDTA